MELTEVEMIAAQIGFSEGSRSGFVLGGVYAVCCTIGVAVLVHLIIFMI